MPTAPVWERWAGTLQCVAVSALGTLGLCWLAQASQRTELGQRVDEAGMHAVAASEAGTRDLVRLLSNISIGSLIIVMVVLGGLALLRGRIAAAVAALTLVAGANVTTQVIKHTYDRADYSMLTVPSLPSGHTTVVTSVALAALLVTPPAWRLAVSLVGSLAITIAATATLVGGWHRPADVAAALIVSLVWGCLTLVVWGVAAGGVARPPRQPHGPLAAVGIVLAAALLIGLGVRPTGGWSGFFDAAVVLGGIGLGAAGVVWTFAILSAPLAVIAPRVGRPSPVGRHDAFDDPPPIDPPAAADPQRLP